MAVQQLIFSLLKPACILCHGVMHLLQLLRLAAQPQLQQLVHALEGLSANSPVARGCSAR